MSAAMDGAMTEAGGRRAQALRALEASGRRLMQRSDGWAVIGRDARRRPVVRIDAADARALIDAGWVMAAAGGGFVLAEGVLADGVRAPDADAALFDAREAARAFAEAHAGRKAAGGFGFAGLARLAAQGEGPLSMRAAQAGLWLRATAELAARRRGLTMNWSATPLDRGARRAGDGGLPDAARRAAMRVERMRRALGADAFALVWAACVEGETLGALERRLGLGARRGAELLGQALERLADAMDGV